MRCINTGSNNAFPNIGTGADVWNTSGYPWPILVYFDLMDQILKQQEENLTVSVLILNQP